MQLYAAKLSFFTKDTFPKNWLNLVPIQYTSVDFSYGHNSGPGLPIPLRHQHSTTVVTKQK